MLHIYRQITALRRCAPVVIAQKREQTGRFPFEAVEIVPKPTTHFVRRFWYRQLRDMPWQISDAELRVLLRVLSSLGLAVKMGRKYVAMPSPFPLPRPDAPLLGELVFRDALAIAGVSVWKYGVRSMRTLYGGAPLGAICFE